MYVEEDVFNHKVFKNVLEIKKETEETNESNDQTMIKVFKKPSDQISANSYKNETSDEDKIDFIICIGGDGTILHISSLFKVIKVPYFEFNLKFKFLVLFHFFIFRFFQNNKFYKIII